VQDDQLLHYGLKFSLEAIISRELRERFKSKIPRQFRGLSSKLGTIRVRPYGFFIPETFFISPAINNTGMYGFNLRPIALNVPLIKTGVWFTIGVGLDITYAYLHSDDPTLFGDDGMHFFRPGLDATAELEIPFSSSVWISGGWASYFYIPQALNGGVFEIGEGNRHIWHIGQAFLKFHVRFPYEIRI